MPQNKLHIISFDIPDPPNYGGVIVVYHHLKALAAKGIKITLHCFQYGKRKPTPQLAELCEKIYYYRRRKSVIALISQTPFIVLSRFNSILLDNLLKDDAPIFFEGIHTCAFIQHKALAKRQKIVRMHNVEWEYYQSLADMESNPLKRLYFKAESQKLLNFEKIVFENANTILTLSPSDNTYFKNKFAETHYIPVFHANKAVTSEKGTGKYILYHGKLSVKDNEKAARFIIEDIAPQVDVPFIIAGLNPSLTLIKLAQKRKNVSIQANLSQTDMDTLIANAHINLLWTYQDAGMKLKLIDALYKGRHCLVNKLMVRNTGLEDLCWVCLDAEEVSNTILELFENEPMDEDAIQKRKKTMEKLFSNLDNAEKTIELLDFEV